MSSIITSAFRLLQAQTFIDSFTNELSTSNLYLGISKPTAWKTESIPDVPNESTKSNKEDWDEMIAMKKIVSAHVRSVIPRYDWYAGEYYTPWDDNNSEIWNEMFYVLTDAYCIYKCINVPIDEEGNQIPSTICPTNTQVNNGSTFKTSDGYEWKFMGRVENVDVPYLSSSWIPIKYITDADYDEARTSYVQNDIQQASVEGTVDRIVIERKTSQFPFTESTNIINNRLSDIVVKITGDGHGATAYATGYSTDGGYVINQIVMASKGTGYTWAEVELDGPVSMNGCELRCVISPAGGHGSNIVSELGAFYNMISVTFNQSEDGEVTVDNDYRKLILIANPTTRSGVRLTDNIYDLRTKYAYTGLTGNSVLTEYLDRKFQETSDQGDDVFFSGKLIDAETTGDSPNSSSGVVTFIDTTYNDIPKLGSSVMSGFNEDGTALAGGPQFTLSDIVNDPYGIHEPEGSASRNNSIRKYSGTILYKDYRKVISRSNDQSEQINIIFEF